MTGSAVLVPEPVPMNVTAPVSTASVGLTSMTSVVQPLPSAKCGNKRVSVDADASGATGSVVIRNSDRSFVNPRNATTATGTSEVNVNVPPTEVPLKSLMRCVRVARWATRATKVGNSP